MRVEQVVVMGMVVAMAAVVAGCGPRGREADNPLLETWDTPLGAPPFDRIRPEHFEPAFEAAMAAHDREIQAIVTNPEPPTFANTIAALDASGELLERVRLVFENLVEADTSDELQEIARRVNPKLSRHEDSIFMNEALFRRVKAVWDARENAGLDPEQSRLLEKVYRRFVRGGATLDPKAKRQLEEINARLAELTTRFGDNLRREMNAVALLITDPADLAGLPPQVRDAAAELAEASGHPGAWAFNLQRTSWTPFMQYSTRRDLRKKLYTAYLGLCAHGGETDNRELAARIAALRVRRARLLGYPTHAAYVLEENMAGTPDAVYDLLRRLWTPALEKAKAERDALQALARRLGDDIRLEKWDWWYYAEKLRAEKYAFDESEVRPYLELHRVREATFDLAHRLWGLEFVKRPDVPVYHPDVEAYEVRDADGSTLALFYWDPYARESKRGGAWMNVYRNQWVTPEGRDVRPIVVNVTNIARPPEGRPALLSLDEAATIFHEFGHALHGMLSRVHHRSLSGTNVDRDFVEFPSQFFEAWALEPEILKEYAVHWQTGEPIPDELVARIRRARTFNQGFATTEYLAASFLDMDWHTLTDDTPRETEAFEAASMERIGLIPEIAPRYRTPYFGHIFSGGYAAGYYSYVWAEVLDADAFAAFREAGLFDPELARRFREAILERGDTEDPMTLYVRFRGRKPSIEPLLERRGLLEVR